MLSAVPEFPGMSEELASSDVSFVAPGSHQWDIARIVRVDSNVHGVASALFAQLTGELVKLLGFFLTSLDANSCDVEAG